jgi:hypothetical protein
VTPIPAEPPIAGVLWSVVIPALLLTTTVLATYLLYRHFAGQDADRPHGGPGSVDAPRDR